MRTFRKEGIKDNAGSTLGFAPHAEEAGQPLAETVSFGLIRLYSKPNCGGRTRKSGTANAAPETFAQYACDQGQFTAAAGDVERLKFAGMAAQKLLRGSKRLFHER